LKTSSFQINMSGADVCSQHPDKSFIRV